MSKKKNKKGDAEAPSAGEGETGILSEDMGCGEDVGNYGDVIVKKSGQVFLRYDHGGVPWYLALLFLAYLTFAIRYISVNILSAM